MTAAEIPPPLEGPARAPAVDPAERQRLRAVFFRLAQLEQRCEAGSQQRSFVATPDNHPAGFAWVPAGLDEVPHLDHSRVVELRGPQGQELLFIPLGELALVVRQAAADRGYAESDLRALSSLLPDSPEVAVNSLFDLICRLVRAQAAT